jgi:hypothetical protein
MSCHTDVDESPLPVAAPWPSKQQQTEQAEMERHRVATTPCSITLSVDDYATNDVVQYSLDDANDTAAAAAGNDDGEEDGAAVAKQLAMHTRLSPSDAESVTLRITETGQRVVSRSRPRCSSLPTLRGLVSIETGEARGALASKVIPSIGLPSVKLNHPGGSGSSEEGHQSLLGAAMLAAVGAGPRQRRSISTDRLYMLEPIEEELGSQQHGSSSHGQQSGGHLSVSARQARRYSAPNAGLTDI